MLYNAKAVTVGIVAFLVVCTSPFWAGFGSSDYANTCLKCHNDYEQFCDKCHKTNNVEPYCWSCHVLPKGSK